MNQLKWVGFCGVLSLIACSSSSNDGDNGGKLSGSGASAGAAGAATGGGGNAGAGVGGASAAGAAGAGNTAAVGGTGAVAAADGSTCDLLFSDYKAAVSAAGECTPGAPSQCELLVQANPGCGEYTLVEATNTDAIADVDSLKSQWTASGCSVSCGLGGYGATEAICEPSAGTGYCKVTKH